LVQNKIYTKDNKQKTVLQVYRLFFELLEIHLLPNVCISLLIPKNSNHISANGGFITKYAIVQEIVHRKSE